MVGKEGVEVTHLQFAGDTILFLPNNKENFKHVLQIFEVVSGLHINLSKCGLWGLAFMIGL